MKKNKSYFFFELHPLNLPLAFLLKRIGNVYVFRYKGFCQRYLKTDSYPSMNDFKDVDQWVIQKEIAYKTIRDHYLELKNTSPSFTLKGKHIPLEKIYVQQFSIDYEFYLFYIRLMNNHEGEKIIVNFSLRDFIKKNHPQVAFDNFSSINFVPLFLDNTYQHIEFCGKIIRTLKLFRGKSSFSSKRFKYLSSGISPSEYPTAENTLNFSWMVKNKIIPSNDILYLLDVPPDEESARYLKETDINYSTKVDLLASIKLVQKCRLLLSLIKMWIVHLFKMNYRNYFKVRSFFTSARMLEIFELTQPDAFLYSQSEGWPEPSESSIARALNIKAILWFYSASEFLSANNYTEFKDYGIRFSSNAASEIWVWSTLLKKIVKERMFAPEDTQVLAVGPILNGDWKNIHSTPAQFTITFFDITPMNARNRLNDGEGPFCNKFLQEKFYEGVLKIHAQFPDIKLVIKTKRHFDPYVFDRTESLETLKGMKSRNIIFADPKIDPYTLIAESSLVISIPYTSPSMLSLSLKRPGLYYNPLNTSKYTFKNAFAPITITREEDLLNYIEKFKRNEIEPHFPQEFLPETKNMQETTELIRNRLKN